MRRARRSATVVAAALLVAGCGGGSDDEPTPVTLRELDGVVVTVAPDDLAGDPIVIGSVPDSARGLDGEELGAGGATPPAGSTDERGAGDLRSEGGGEGASADDGSDDGVNPFGGDAPEDGLMPDVVCRSLQDAQDEIQDHGVFLSRSEDATGEGRRQLWDRNWVVVAQDPAPGTPIGEGDALLSVVKHDETDDC